jgi:transposase-like protein
MPHKGKLSTEEKVQIVEGYINGKIGQREIQTRYGVGSVALRDWKRLYTTRGVEGLIPATSFKKYSPETKRMAVDDYLSGEGSQNDICIQYDISSRAILRQWIKVYNSHGELKQPNTGGAIYMAKGRSTTLEERVEIVSHCIANNNDYGKTVEQYGVSYQQVYGWVRKYKRDGPDGLVDRRGKRKDELMMTEAEKLRAQLKLKEAEILRLQMENDLLKKLEEIERGRGRN